jgi:hypothetical protein
MGYGTSVAAVADGIRIGSTTLSKASLPQPSATPPKFQGLLGEYGWDHDILYVFEKDNHLNVLIEWMEFDKLTQESDDVFKFPAYGLYDGEKAIFARDGAGNATQVRVSGVVFKRRPIGGVSSGIFRIPPVKNFDELRRQALAANPPKEVGDFRNADLVELSTLDPSKAGHSHATTTTTSACLFSGRASPATCSRRATAGTQTLGDGLRTVNHDALRPWLSPRYSGTPRQRGAIFVADLSRVHHNRGCVAIGL